MLRREEDLVDDSVICKTAFWVRRSLADVGPYDTATPFRYGICCLLCYIVLLLAAARLVFLYHSWSFEWMPKNVATILIFFFFSFNVTLGPLFVVAWEVISEIKHIWRKESYQRAETSVKKLVIKYVRIYLLNGAVAYFLVYCVLLSYTNLKPAIPLLNDALYDDVLFKCDNSLLNFLSFGGLCTIPKNSTLTACFDMIYFKLWPIACLTLLISSRESTIFWRFISAWCIAYGLSIPISILFPTLGPAFFKPELFSHVSGTHSGMVMGGLVKHYLSFKMDPLQTPIVSANGIVGMPSLHIALAYLSSVAIGKVFPWLRFIMWGVTLLFLVTTVYLGWHYLLDGIAGVAVGWIAYWISTRWFYQEVP